MIIAIHSEGGSHQAVAAAPLRVSGAMGRRPWIGIWSLVLGALIFGVLTYNLRTQGLLLQWDVPLANSLHAMALNGPGYARPLIIAGFYLGREVTAVIAVLLCSYYLYKRYWREFWMVALGFGGAGMLWYFLSRLFARPRPVFPAPIWLQLHSGSFPSGHAITAVVAYGFLAYMLGSQTTSLLQKWVYALLALAMILFIGFSRLYAGDHYLTDVLAGYALGLVWAGLVFTVGEIIFRKRNQPHDS